MTDKVILYPQENGSVAVMRPVYGCGLTVEQIAAKDVPFGVPYIIVNSSDIPTDETFFNAWEADFSNPEGHGGAKS